MVTAAVAGYLALGTAVASAAVTARAGRKSRASQAEVARVRGVQAAVARRAERQRALASLAKRRASIKAQSAEQLGVGSTSTAADQAGGALRSQLASNVGLQTQLQGLEDERTAHKQAAADAITKGQTTSAALGVVSAGFSSGVFTKAPTTTGFQGDGPRLSYGNS
jgi:hypothetical protein